MSKNKKDPIQELCKSNCEIIPIEQTEPEATKYANYVKRTTFKRVYEGSPYNLQLRRTEFDTLEIEFTPVGTPLYYEVYLRQLPEYTSLPPYTFMSNRGRLGGLVMNTEYEVDVVAYYVSNQTFHLNKKRIYETLDESPPANMIVTTPTGLINYTAPLFFNLSFTDASGSVSNYSVKTFSEDVSYTQTVFTNQNNVIHDLIANETYVLELTSFYESDVVNPDYTLTQTVQMINETPVSDISFINITGHTVDVNFASATGNISDVSYTILFYDQSQNIITETTFGSSDTTVDVSFQDLEHNHHYDVEIISHYKTNNNSYLIDSSFNTLNETSVSNFSIVNGPENVEITFDNSPDFSTNDTYTIILRDVSNDTQLGNQVNASGATTIEGVTISNEFVTIDISSTFQSLVVDNSYNVIVTSNYTDTGHTYTNQFEFKTLNEGIIESCSVIEDSLTGVSVDLSIVSFRGSTPIEYIITFKRELVSLEIVDISFSRTPNDLFFDNVLVKDTSYNVFVESIYATENLYKRTPGVADVSFVTKNEEALSPDVITITPFGTYIEADINYEKIGDLSSNFDFEIIDQVSNVIELSGSAVAVDNASFNINTLETHSHKLQFNTLYRFKLVAKFGTPVREYYTFKTFSTLDEFPLYISVSDNFTITGREASFNINGTEDISRNIDYVFYDVSLGEQDYSGNYDIFPVSFTNLTSGTDYTVFIRSTFDICGNENDNNGNAYDISYTFQTLDESEVAYIQFNNAPAYNPYYTVLITNGGANPGNKQAVATFGPPSGNSYILYVKVQTSDRVRTIIDRSYSVTGGDHKETQDISGLEINTNYIIEVTTEYPTGNRYQKSESFRTKNEKEVGILEDFYVYTTNDSIAVDFLQTPLAGTDCSYTLVITVLGQENISFVQIDPPLDFDVSGLIADGTLSTDISYTSVILTTYESTNNVYESSSFVIKLGFTSEQYIKSGDFAITSEDYGINDRGFTFSLPDVWNTSKSVVIAESTSSEPPPIFYKTNPNSSSEYCAIIYLPSNLNNNKVLIQSINQTRGPNSDPDNNLYEGYYDIRFYAATHKEAGEIFSFGNITDPTINYDVKLVNKNNSTAIVSQSFTSSSISYELIEMRFHVETSYDNVEFQIKRTGNEKNNLYIMDLSMVSVIPETTDNTNTDGTDADGTDAGGTGSSSSQTTVYNVSLNTDPFSSPYYVFTNTHTDESEIPILQKGNTYTFTRTDSGHPFNVGDSYGSNTTNIAVTSTSTNSTNSVNNVNSIVSGESLTFTIPVDFNGSFSYFCTSHSTMINQFTISA